MIAIPVSIVGTFGIMYLLGYSLDNLSLMALTLSVGFVVDDAIVMLENIVRHIEAGQRRLAAGTGQQHRLAEPVVLLLRRRQAVRRQQRGDRRRHVRDQPRIERRLTERAFVAGLDPAEVEFVAGQRHDEAGEMVGGDEVLHVERQQQRLIDLPGSEMLAHASKQNMTRAKLNSDYSDRLLVPGQVCAALLRGGFLGHHGSRLSRECERREAFLSRGRLYLTAMPVSGIRAACRMGSSFWGRGSPRRSLP